MIHHATKNKEKKMKLNTDPWDYSGPMAYNEEMRDYIEKNGKPLSSLEFIVDDKYPRYSRDIHILHVPSGKVNAYAVYFDTKKNLRAFDGFGAPVVDYVPEEIIAVYKSDFHPNGPYRSFDDERLDEAINKMREDGVDRNKIPGLLKIEYEKGQE